MTRHEQEKAVLREQRTAAWDRIKAEHPAQVPAVLVAQWREAYGDGQLAAMEARQQVERSTLSAQLQERQQPTIIPQPQSVDDMQAERDRKRAEYIQQAQEILERQRGKDRDR
ncbi:hypothetical protein [Runella aurantiaca]|nr:hypothetical protein [Runella aurantiaca]